MSTLKTTNLQESNASSANIVLGTGSGGGATISGVCTATSFSGSGANLTGITGTTINNNANNRLITGSGTANTLEGEATLTYDGTTLEVSNATPKLKLTDSDATGTPEAMVDGSGGDLILHVDKDNEKGSSLFAVKIDNSEKARIDSSGNFLIRTTSLNNSAVNGQALQINGTTRPTLILRGNSDGNQSGEIQFADNSGSDDDNTGIRAGLIQYHHGSNYMLFRTDGAERLRISSTGELKVTGGTTARALKVNCLHTSGGEIACFDNGVNNHYGALVISGGEIDRECRLEAAYGNSFLTFYTQAGSGTEKMRITSDGRVRFAMNNFGASPSTSNYGIEIANTNMASVWSATGTSTANHIIWVNANGTCGSIQTSGSNTSYNTSSDYRLKENNAAISDGIARVKNLKPYRFNWIADSTNTPQDGFFAHEVQSVVPEAASGTKDQVELEDDDERDIKKGDIIPQGIDQSKLVPLLTAALQEAIAEIETLKTKVAALESA